MLLHRYLRFTITLTATLFLVLVSLVTAHAAVDCFSCHERAAFDKRVNHAPAAAGECLSCHNPHVAKFEGLLQETVKELCYSCHADAQEEQSRGIVHMPVRKGECTACHDPHGSNQAGMLQDRSSEICFNCHSDLPRKYKHNHAPFAGGQCDACHRPHQSENPNLLVRDSDSLCLGCHSSGEVKRSHPGFPVEPANCGSCHNPHGSERPALVRNVLHEAYTFGCGTCHSGDEPVVVDDCLSCHPEVTEQMSSSHNHLVRYEDNGCMACHSPHAGDDERLLKGRERHVCGTCHEGTFERYDASEHKHRMTDACNDCHAPHGSNHPAMTKAPINDVCGTCHGEHGTFTHPIGEDVFDPRTGQMMTCISCHSTKGSEHEYHTRLDRKKALCVQCHAEY